MFEFTPKFLYIYEEVADIRGYGNEIQFCIPSFLSDGVFHCLKDSLPPFYFDVNKIVFKYFFAFDYITDNYAYIDFGGTRLFTGQTGSKRYAYRYYNQGKIVGNTFYWYAKSERKGAYAGDPIEDIEDSNSFERQLNYTGATYYWLAF